MLWRLDKKILLIDDANNVNNVLKMLNDYPMQNVMHMFADLSPVI